MDLGLSELRARLRARLAKLRERVGDNDPDVQAMEADLAEDDASGTKADGYTPPDGERA